MQTDLSEQQAKLLNYLRTYLSHNNESPSLAEIVSFLDIKAKSTADQHIRALEKKGYVTRKPGAFRGIILNEAEEGTIEIPLLGTVAAGKPIEAIEEPETIKIPKRVIPHYNINYFALKVKGDSMIEDGIYDGEIAVVESRNYAQNGDLVVAKDMDNNVTLKYFYRENNRIRLEPRNPKLPNIYMDVCEIIGILRGLTNNKAIF